MNRIPEAIPSSRGRSCRHVVSLGVCLAVFAGCATQTTLQPGFGQSYSAALSTQTTNLDDQQGFTAKDAKAVSNALDKAMSGEKESKGAQSTFGH